MSLILVRWRGGSRCRATSSSPRLASIDEPRTGFARGGLAGSAVHRACVENARRGRGGCAADPRWLSRAPRRGRSLVVGADGRGPNGERIAVLVEDNFSAEPVQ